MERITGIVSSSLSGQGHRTEQPEVSIFGPERQPPPKTSTGKTPLGALLLLGIGLTLPGAGCATVIPPARPDFCRVAVRYDVEPLHIGAQRQRAWEVTETAFRRMHELGLDTVALWHVEDADRHALLDLAANAEMMALVPDRALEHYVVAGALPRDCPDVAALIRSVPRDIVKHPACAGIVLSPPRGPDAATRADMIRERARGRLALTADPIVIDSGTTEAKPESSRVEEWLGQYHDALAAGRTGLVVLDRYRRPSGDPDGLLPTTGEVEPAAAAAIDMLTRRARRWGRHLQGLSAHRVPGVQADTADVTVTGFSKGRRRYVLVTNTTRDRYAHAEVAVPATIDGESVARAVEVPGSDGQPAGRVVHARSGLLRLDVSLRPGDAVLFELF